jgi:hypothetical protein
MRTCSWNVRGLGGRIKKKKVKELILREKVDVLAIQESKLASVDHKLCSRLWGGEDVGWRTAPAIGRVAVSSLCGMLIKGSWWILSKDKVTWGWCYFGVLIKLNVSLLMSMPRVISKQKKPCRSTSWWL